MQAPLSRRHRALEALGRALMTTGYEFVTVTPETHRRVLERRRARHTLARNLRDVLGWNLPFEAGALPSEIFRLMQEADVLEPERGLFRPKIRASTLRGRLYFHSSYPTDDVDAVFFGPDTYRFDAFVSAQLQRMNRRFDRLVDVGCGTGAGGLGAREWAAQVVLGDINRHALEIAAVHVRLGVQGSDAISDAIELARSDVLSGVDGAFDCVIANPPYLHDPAERAYRHGGGLLGAELGLRIVAAALDRLSAGGVLLLYTGAAIVDGFDAFRAASQGLCIEAKASFAYAEIDPDVFGEEIEDHEAYAGADRIAAVGLVAIKR